MGGSDPRALAESSRLAAQWGYDEINLNVGCPSERVQSGAFGACLMKEPLLVRDCLEAMVAASTLPVTVKHRTGVDDQDSYDFLCRFVETVSDSGVKTFIIHARKAWLKGLSPKQNRELPPLDYQRVYQLKRDYPHLEIIINGGIDNISQCKEHLRHVDGVMLGRAAYQDPWCLAGVDPQLFGHDAPSASPRQAVERLFPYIEEQLSEGARLHHVTRHLMGMFRGVPGARGFRRHLSEHANRPGAGIEVLQAAMAQIEPAAAMT